MTDPRPPTDSDPAPPGGPEPAPQTAAAELEELAGHCWRFCHLAGLHFESLRTRLDPELARRAASAERALRHALGVVCSAVPTAAAEMLIAAEERSPEWRHPRSVLREPSPDLGEVLAASRRLRERAADADRERIERVLAKLEIAARIDADVRRRLEQKGDR